VSCGFVVGDCRNCALASAVLWPGVPVSADGQDVIRRDRRADRALLAPRVAGYRASGVGAYPAEMELLKAAGRQKLAAGQGELDLGLQAGAPGGPLLPGTCGSWCSAVAFRAPW